MGCKPFQFSPIGIDYRFFNVYFEEEVYMNKQEIKQHFNDIVQLKEQGKTYKEIAEMYDSSPSSIGRLLRENGKSYRTKLTKELYAQIIREYIEGNSITFLAKKYNLSQSTISDILKKEKIEIKPPSSYYTKWHIDEKYFDVIDTPDKAYIIGLLYADGYNNMSSHRVSLSLQETDKSILEKIRECIDYDCPLIFKDYNSKNPNWQNQYELSITRKYLSEQLAKLGVVQNKSLILTFPQWLDSNLYFDFIRGYFDGDGHISTKECRISLVGTQSFCEEIAIILNTILGIHCSIFLCHGNSETSIRALQVAGRNQVKTFLDSLYLNANLYIPRKYNQYQKMYV